MTTDYTTVSDNPSASVRAPTRTSASHPAFGICQWTNSLKTFGWSTWCLYAIKPAERCEASLQQLELSRFLQIDSVTSCSGGTGLQQSRVVRRAGWLKEGPSSGRRRRKIIIIIRIIPPEGARAPPRGIPNIWHIWHSLHSGTDASERSRTSSFQSCSWVSGTGDKHNQTHQNVRSVMKQSLLNTSLSPQTLRKGEPLKRCFPLTKPSFLSWSHHPAVCWRTRMWKNWAQCGQGAPGLWHFI